MNNYPEKPNKHKAIVATSSACFQSIHKPHNVFDLPINIHINGESFLDGQSISITELSNRILSNPNLSVSTSAPDEGQLIEFFFELIHQGINEIMVITISSKVSLTYQTIRSIQSIFGDKLKIHLFDSRSISHGEAVLVYEAAKMLDEGKDFSEIFVRLNHIRDKMTVFVTVDNVKTMVKTKRLSAPAGFFATLLDIKPVVHLDKTGTLVAYEKIRGFDESLYRVVELIAEHANGKKGDFYTACNDINPYLPALKRVAREFGIKITFNAPLTNVVIANVGVYALAMMFVEE